MALDYTHVVIGAGAVGLAVGARLARIGGNRVLIMDKHSQIGSETSSRNSEVIHAGLYYPPNSLKSRLCIRGKELIYELPKSDGFRDFRQCGKFVVSQSPKETEYLHKLQNNAKSTGVPLEFVSLDRAKQLEPNVIARDAVLNSPSTGIINAHGLMQLYQKHFEESGGDLALLTEAKGISPINGGYEITCTSVGEEVTINTSKVINSAGLYAPNIANMVGLNNYKPFYAKGNYFSFSSSQGSSLVNRLIYPCPADNGSLGTHLTIDLAGNIKFGPDFEWVNSPTDYLVNTANLGRAKEAITRYMRIDTNKLVPDYSGIRPKLSDDVKSFTDFIIKEDLPGFVNLLGIESPGLTSSLAIAEYVEPLAMK